MSDYIGSRPIAQRLSNDERSDAIQALSRFEGEGRLSPEELATRTAAAQVAVTWGDLVPLFNDLPPIGKAQPAYSGGGVAGAEFDNNAEAFGGDSPWQGRRRARGGAVGATIMALTPFIAILLFFLTSYTVGWAWSWLWFLLIPIAGIIVWGPNSGYRDTRR